MPDGIDTSIYRNQPNPLANLTSVFGIMNAAQQNQLLQTANQRQLFELNKARTDAVIGGLAPLAARDDITKPVALGNVAAIIKATQIPPEVAGPILDQIRNAPDNPKALKSVLGNLYAIMSGTGAGTPVTGPVQPGTLAPTQTPAAQRVTQGTIPVTAGPAATAAATAVGGGAGQLLAGQGAEGIDYRNQVNPLEQAIPALERLGRTGTGPGTEEINRMKSVAISFGFPGADRWTGSVKDFDEAQKYLVQQARSFGNTATSDQLAAAFSGNPNMKMSNAAAVDVAKTMLALRRMKHMQYQAFLQKKQLDPSVTDDQFPGFASQWNAQHDPRAFGFDHMTVEQRKKVLQSIPTKEKKAQFMFDVDAADKAGVLTNQ